MLIYDSQGSESSIRRAMEILEINYDLRTSTNPVTLADLATHDILIVGWNVGGDMSGLDPAILTSGILGRVLLTGHDADYHTVNGPPVAQTLLSQAISYVLEAPGTGLLTLGDTVAFSYLPPSWGISAKAVGGQTITAFTAEGLASGVYDGLEPRELCNWNTSYHDKFTAWGPDFVPFELGGTGEDVITIARARACGPTLTESDDVNDGDCRRPGDEINYTIDYNYPSGPNCGDIHDVNIIDFLPDEVEYVWSEPEPNEILDCNTIIWGIGTLKAGDANCITLKVRVKCVESGSTITNCCEIKSGNWTLRNACENTPVCANCLVVDDFESYNNTFNIIYRTWKDGVGYPGYPGNGTGSRAGYRDPNYAEETIVHGGRQSMPFDYNNLESPYDSNVHREFGNPQNWTGLGVKALSLWLRGYMAPVGSFTRSGYSPNYTYMMTASGTDINVPNSRNSATPPYRRFHDEFHYAYIPILGDCDIIVRVDSITNTDPQAKAGVMIRDSLNDDSTFAMMCITPGSSGIWFQYRAVAGGTTITYSNATTPYWIWLRREWSEFGFYEYTAYYSASGGAGNWTPLVGYDTPPPIISMTEPVYIGLSLTACNAEATCTAVFSNVSVTQGAGLWHNWPNVRGDPVTLPWPWPSRDIGIKSNTAAPLYVTLQDSNNIAATVTHPDPNIALACTWQEWLIPLTRFSNMDLTAINKITIGLGNRSDANGVGTLFFDDIRLCPPRCLPEFRPVADFTCDCAVNYWDLKIMADEWLSTRCPRTDLYEDGAIDFKDFAILAENWLEERLSP